MLSQQQHVQVQEALLSYPQHIYYSPAAGVAPAPYVPLASDLSSSAASQPRPASSLFAVPSLGAMPSDPSNNCCKIACPGCNACWPACDGCQSCDPCCLACCAASSACAPGGCCSPTGCCSTRCGGSVGAWSGSVALQWVAFALLLAALCMREWFANGDAVVGLWTICPNQYWNRNSCDMLDYQTLLFITDIHVYLALRAFAVLSLVALLASAVLSSIRLARHQRHAFISVRFERIVQAVGATTLVLLLIALVLCVVAVNAFHVIRYASWSLRAGGILLCIAFSLALLAIPLHAVTTLRHARVMGAAEAAAQGVADNSAPLVGAAPSASVMDVAVPPAAPSAPLTYSSSFQHPAPATVYTAQYTPHPLHTPLGYHLPAAQAPHW